jgi:hypothetical protein
MPKKPVLEVMTLGELQKASAAINRKLAKQIVIDEKNDTCTINIAYPYEVDLDRINDERDLLAWTLHLKEKNWMKTKHLAFFIKAVAKYKGFNLHLGRYLASSLARRLAVQCQLKFPSDAN